MSVPSGGTKFAVDEDDAAGDDHAGHSAGQPSGKSHKRKDLYGGLLMVAIGAFAIYRGLSYHVGSLVSMGPGFFPVSLGVILVAVGLAIAILHSPAAGGPGAGETWHGIDWRGWLCIGLAIVAFIALGRHGGLVPATFAIVFISALGDRSNSLLSAFTLAVAMTVLCVVIFWWALQLQLPLFSWD
jgi:hypothetical protein